jgi:isoquinoline 1-oxidoreductase subunit beta
MGFKRRAFLIGGAAIAGGGVFALQYGDYAGRRDALALTRTDKAGSFTGWLRIGEDNRVTMFTPHIDMGGGTSTALAQMAADELDADWNMMIVEQAPVEPGFANAWLSKAILADPEMGMVALAMLPDSVFSAVARNGIQQMTGGSSAVRGTGQQGFRMLAAGVRQLLVEEAAERLGVPASELATANGVITHQETGKSLRYGELAQAAAKRSLPTKPALKDPKDFTLIGKSVPRIDIPGKVDGSTKFGIDVALPDMRVATIMAAPVRGGKLESVDPAPALAVKGVEKVISLENAVAVVASGYWPALKGLRSLSPKFSNNGSGAIATASMFAEQEKLANEAATTPEAGAGKLVEASYRTPYLHHATMETFALTAHHKDGRLEVWGGLQDPLRAKHAIASAAGLDFENVTFHSMPLGGGFGRKFPFSLEILDQVVNLAMQLPWPIKIIWPREEEVAQGTYRPQGATTIRAALTPAGKIAAWHAAYAQAGGFDVGGSFIYDVPSLERKHVEHTSHILTGSWRSVEATQHGFYNESFIDELAHAAGADPLEFRKRHLASGSRAIAVLDTAAKASGWGAPLPEGSGRGIAVVECFGTVCAHVVQASVGDDGYPKVEKVWAAVDCGQIVNPRNADAQVMGGIVMGLSAAIHEEITIDKGAVQQTNLSDYRLLSLAETPEIEIQFVPSTAPMGGLGEPGLPPAAPALANALFAATGKRIRHLPIKAQAGSLAQG